MASLNFYKNDKIFCYGNFYGSIKEICFGTLG